jgi:2,4-dienoyl-CoA reductase-like NADH-dependent reductase (Old Yellow Enzyme family)
MTSLFDSVKLGDLILPNRIVMAPLTRSRAGKERVPNALMRDYYVQRAGAGLILTEATAVTPMGVGYADTPGIWSQEQIDGWKMVTDGVHKAGGRIFMQLWHVGRISDPVFLDGKLPVAPSAIAPDGYVSLLRPQRKFVTPRALEHHEVMALVEIYRQGAKNAKLAGFDGVEIHAANGYLIDQFLQSGSNHRTDEYGGPIENRARFLLEIVDGATEVWGAGRVGVHISPRGDSNYVSDANHKETFGYVAKELGKRKIAFIFAREKQGEGYLTPYLKELFGGHFIANEGLARNDAELLLKTKVADSISFGKLYIANPDLVERLRKDAPLNPFNPATFYTAGPEGYVDYPSLQS